MLDAVEKMAQKTGVKATADPIETALKLDHVSQGNLLWRFNKNIDNPHLRTQIATLLAEKLQLLSNLPAASTSDAAQQFARDGLLHLPGLVTPEQAAEIVTYFSGCTNLTRQDTVLHHHSRDIVRAPHIFQIATDERVLSVVHHHLGAPPIAMQMDAWWSMAESDMPMGSQIFHRDRDDFRACKLFLYLTDVTSGDGPHIFARGSHRVDFVSNALASKNISPDKASMFFAGNGRSIADQVEDVFDDAVIEILGPAGTCFLENTYGFHRGKVPKTGRRCVFQVLYGAIPYPDRVDRWADADLKALPAEWSDNPRARQAMAFTLS